MDLSIFDLTDKVAIVTGAGRGIGRAIALGFAQAGADVVVAARTTSEIEDTAAKIRNEGRKAIAIPTDVRNVDQVTDMLHQTLASFNKVDILVNNAGGATENSGKYVLDLSIDAWKEGIELNLNSLFICSKIVGEVMAEHKAGSIINISSGMGLGPCPGIAADAAARAGVNNLTKTLAVEWAPYNIRINAIAPGWTETSLTAKTWEKDPSMRVAILENIPLGRFGKPEDIAAVAIFLASDASSYITGEVIYVSGGLITTVPPRHSK
jgi:NAD(P)-dependent dehydrogenase (short-subunit alcohol dehydrogenase family)